MNKTLNKRNEDLVKLINNNEINFWEAKVVKIKKYSQNKFFISVLIESIYFETFDDPSLDLLYETMTASDSLFENILEINPNDKVLISGSFFINNEGFFEQKNLFKKSMLDKPVFIFKFSKIEKIE